MTLEPRIYVADLAAYNAGMLHGRWIDATQDIESIRAEVLALLERSPVSDAEEYAIHSYEGFGDFSISEHEGLKSAHKKALFIKEHQELGAAVLNHWCGDIKQAKEALSEHYAGQHHSLADYAQELTEETTKIPNKLLYYIDYDAMGRDMELNGDIYTIETTHDEVHVFWNH